MNSPRDAGGFTLLEVLMVMVIIGAVSSMVSLVAPVSPERQARGEAQRLAQRVQAARESAVLEGREYGLRLAPDEYLLLRLEGGAWRAQGLAHRLPDALKLQLRQAGLAVQVHGQAAVPQLLALSSDEYSPFEVSFHRNGQRLSRVAGDGLGEPSIHED